MLVVPTPSGVPFTQEIAAELSTREHLVFACGRYEGIDQRVIDDAATRYEVRELSLGDYVLNGGEVAALAIIEAVVRLIPGFMGNAESLAEESHTDGLLEYPVFTKPAAWRGHDVPDVLLSGDHARIAAWRHDQSVRRTADRRPDLLPPSHDLDGIEIRRLVPGDVGELFTLQRACWVQEQHDNPGVEIPALAESLADVEAWTRTDTVLVARSAGRLVGAVRGRAGDDGTWDIGRLMVAPDLQGRGLGRELLGLIEEAAPETTTGFALFTGAGSARNQRMYKKAGYRLRGEIAPGRRASHQTTRLSNLSPPCRNPASRPDVGVKQTPPRGDRHALPDDACPGGRRTLPAWVRRALRQPAPRSRPRGARSRRGSWLR